MSKRSPRRSVSSAITSSAPMLPRLTFGPDRRSSHACCARCGASKITVSWPTACEDRVDQLAVHGAGRVEQADGPALAALRRSPARRRPRGRRASPRTSRRRPRPAPLLLPTSAITVNSPASSAISSRLARAAPSAASRWRPRRGRCRARAATRRSGRACPGATAISSSVPPGQIAMPASRQIATLSAHRAAHVRGAPAELDQVDVLAGGDQQRLERQRREPAVEHVRDAGPARLGGPLGQIEERRHPAARDVRRADTVQSPRTIFHALDSRLRAGAAPAPAAHPA